MIKEDALWIIFKGITCTKLEAWAKPPHCDGIRVFKKKKEQKKK